MKFRARIAIGIRGGDGVIFNNKCSPTIYRTIELTAEGFPCRTYPGKSQIRQLYIWNNEAHDHLGITKNGIKNNCTYAIKENRDYFLRRKKNYKPYTYPHPLRRKSKAFAKNKTPKGTFSKLPVNNLLITPNPSNENKKTSLSYIYSGNYSTAFIKIIHLSGRTINHKKMKLKKGNNQIALDFKYDGSPFYIVKLHIGEEVYSTKLLINK